MALPLVIAPRLAVSVSHALRPASPAVSTAHAAQTAQAAQGQAPANETPFVAPKPTVVTQDPESPSVPEESDDWDAAYEPQNRAERRAQQQAQTHAKRARARR
ncbi:hypothetical protein FBY41_3159 [Humibacillus xanthopallidus]|uniref:Uncharacterized protein n=1 Tax=Humibacillus xanthopallidus TaxID=412689 RepID=A0A543HHN1_9MICO|nr:hypothetical protein FBY41_3159 [Humibacillus xanthopallidus]